MTRILFIRHAETGMAGTFCGQSDPPLNARGQAQLLTLQAALAAESIDCIVSSDLLRAQQTAQALGSQQHVTIATNRNLREIHFGEWEGLNWHQVEEQFPEESLAWLGLFPEQATPGGETYTAFCERVITALEEIRKMQSNTIAVIAHAGVLRLALQHLMGLSFTQAQQQPVDYGSFFVYETEAAQ